MIRITGGRLRGRVLKTTIPEGIRPTAARTREALFSMVGQNLQGWSMLDLFGGTGLMAIEGASRGAEPVLIVERNPRFAKLIRQSLQELGLRLQLREGDALRIDLPASDFVFSDPPYDLPLSEWLPKAASLTRRLLAAEARTGAVWPAEIGELRRDRVRSYGDSELAIYLHKSMISDDETEDEGDMEAASS